MRTFAFVSLLLVAPWLAGCDSRGTTLGEQSGLPSGVDLLSNGQFDQVSAPWMEYFAPGAAGTLGLESGQLCLTVTARGTNEWDAQMRARGISLQQGHRISVRMLASSTPAARVSLKLAMQAAPYTAYWQAQVELGPEPRSVESSFVMSAASDDVAELVIMAGASLTRSVPTKVCIDDVSVRDPEATLRPGENEPEPSVVRVNQLGFRTDASKLGVLVGDGAEPRAFSLITDDGTEAFRAMSEPRGRDAASGDDVQWLDFSAFTAHCESCRLEVEGASSAPFRIADDVLAPLISSSLEYFYYNRSGTPIVMPYAGELRWSRPAGHLGDSHVTCLKEHPCDYFLDASGGWYDAGDYGKYLVNGGLALFLLQNLFEHQRYSSLPAFDDGSLAIPEGGNGVPDLLDEARWESEFFLRMQIPSGPLAGMAHHKLHGTDWTSLGTAPDEDTQTRYLHPPSTAATLNLAATAAQASRLSREYDAPFAARSLAAAEAAYAAALAHPAEFAPNQSEGGGPYDDVYVEDEFYWAASELWLTTNDSRYWDALRRSPLFGAVPSLVEPSRSDAGHYRALTWQNVEALGTFSLLLGLERLPADARESLRANLLSAAERYVSVSEHEGYRLPYAPGKDGSYLWGSNVVVLSNAIVCAYAYDLVGDPRYLRVVQDALDYVLGRNALDRSYVTGVGERPVRFPHHRFWSHSVRAERPPPPAGAMVSGANSALADTAVKSAVPSGAPPQRCHVDDIEAYSVNEVAVHDNAALAWVATYLDSVRRAP
ncbi:MAG TPA: glycoside hydrolase family 9 protein [Polyangiaceae bacterium]|nr:glycoside hydrolase family 9 protein [Polyangiaceae bacterium]